MFHKPFSFGHRNPLGGKERKKLRKEISRQFHGVSDADLEMLIPSEADVVLAKVHSSKCCVYVVNGDPIFYDADGKFDLFPSVYALWKLPRMVQCFVIHPEVSRFILGGADLMLPGVLRPKSGFKAQHLLMGQKWGIRVLHCPFPFAVGRTLTSALSIEASGMRGKALQCLHYFSDYLWQNGTKQVPLQCFSLQKISFPSEPCVESEFDDVNLDDSGFREGLKAVDAGWEVPLASEIGVSSMKSKEDEGSENLQNEVQQQLENESANQTRNEEVGLSHDVDDNHEQSITRTEPETVFANEEPPVSSKAMQQLSTAQVDFLLQTCLLEALHTSVNDAQLPLDASAVYSKCLFAASYILRHPHVLNTLDKDFGLPATTISEMLVELPPTAIVDIQKSSHKKGLKFIAWATKAKWLDSKEHRGVRTVTKVNRQHPKYKSHVLVPESLIKKIDSGDKPAKNPEDAKAPKPETDKTTSTKGPIVNEYFRFLGKTRGILTAVGKDGAAPEEYLTLDKATSVLNTYILKFIGDDAKRGSVVEIDKTLSNALNIPENTPMERADLAKSFIAALDVSHQIVREQSEGPAEIPKMVKGHVKPILVAEEVRQGRKFITTITEMEKFFIDPKLLSEMLARRMASASSLFDVPVAKNVPKQMGVTVQGKVGDEIANILIQEFGIQKKHIKMKKSGK